MGGQQMRTSIYVRQWRLIASLAVVLALFAIVALGLLQGISKAQKGDTSNLPPHTTALVGGVLLFSLAAGAGSMAIIQLAKQVLGVRAFYQEYKVRQWLGGRGDDTGQPAYDDLIRALGYGKDADGQMGRSEERALFNLPVDRLAAQVSLAADLALSYPGDYPSLLGALTGERRGTEGKPGAGESGKPHPSNPPSKGARVTDADVRLSYQVRGGVDRLQLYVGQGWRRTVRLSAVLISGVLGVIWVQFLTIYPSLSAAYVLSALILGGFISWVLRDLVAIIERLRS